MEGQQDATVLLREKIRNYSLRHREKLRCTNADSVRFGLGEIQAKIEELESLSEKDVIGLAGRIKRRKHATIEDMYRLSHAFLQGIENIRTFAKIPGAIQVLIKELSGHDSERQVSASECICNLSLGEAPVCEKIASMAGGYLVIYLDSPEERLKRTALWTLANVLATSVKAAQTLIQMELVAKLWRFYSADNDTGFGDYREDAAICLQLISLEADKLLRQQDYDFITKNLNSKNPTCTAGEYHLQIIFNILMVNSDFTLDSDEQLLFLINYALCNLNRTCDFDSSSANHLRIVYAIRVLANLLATKSHSQVTFNLVLKQLSTVWQSDLVKLLNKLFAFRNAALTREIMWLVQNILHQQQYQAGDLMSIGFLDKLRIYHVNGEASKEINEERG